LLELDEHDRWFQQDGATPRTLNETMNVLRDVFGDCLISKNIWLRFFPDSTVPNFFPVMSLEGKSL
jgi:hypothetical protein